LNIIVVNGTRIEVDGDLRDVHISGDTIRVGGKVVSLGLSGIVEVKWEGPLANVRSSCSVSVKGDVAGRVDAGGSVSCGDVGGDVDAGGSVSCGDVKGSVEAGGSVRRG